MSELRPVCAQCIYWVTDHTSKTPTAGHCHRYPPGVFVNPNGTVVQKFPMTDRGAWCGEWNGDASHLEAAARQSLTRRP